jgi:polar amino acid transport system substrate-binding protein
MFVKSMKALFLIMMSAAMLNAAPKKTYVIASDCTWPPMEYVDEKKQIVGFDIDLIKAAAKAGGISIEIKNTAWDGIFAGLAAGKFDAVISSVTITDERKKTMDFSSPYLNAGQTLVVRKGAKEMKLSEFKGKSAGAQIGTTGAIEIAKDKSIKLKTYDEIGLAVEDLSNGRIDVVVCDRPTAVSYVLKNSKYQKKLVIAGAPFTDEFYGIAVKKGNSELLDKLNDGLKKVTKSGELKKIEDKWLK